jgi:UDP-4-amino-4,6-dideoxy-L-N-acetyl-beta-L-altrosamine transaminase
MEYIPYSRQSIDNDDIDAVVDVLRSSHLTQGAKVKEFEDELRRYTKAKYAITFNSATSALLASYLACGITKDDEIITSPISFVATSNMFVELGAKPIWCDVKLDGNIDENYIERLITPKTKAIVPIHFAGKPVELEKITKIAKKHNLLIIEDAAHALGSSINDQKIGSISDMSIFSFHAIKPITTAEGGAVLTNNKEYAKKLELIRSHGIVKKQLYSSDMISMGYNFRLTEIAAALGISQLKKLDKFILQRERIARYYDERFKDEKLFSTIKIKDSDKSSRHLYPILLIPALQCPKEDIYKELIEKNIGVQVHYKPIYKNSFYKERFGDTSLMVANDFYLSELSIPCHQKMSLKDAKYVADTLISILHKYHFAGCSF